MRHNLRLRLWIAFLPGQALIPLAGSMVLEEDVQHPDSGMERSRSRLEKAGGKSCSGGWLGTP